MLKIRPPQSWRLLAVSVSLLSLTLLNGGNSASPRPASEIGAKVVVREGPSLPLSTASHVGGIVGRLPVVAGGSRWSDDRKTKRWLRESFVFRDGQWLSGPALPRSLSEAAYASGSRGLYIAGGTDGEQATNHVLYLADTSANASWQPLASLPMPVEAAAGAILASKFYVFGGFSGDRASNQLWRLDLDSPAATWEKLAPLPAEGRGYAAFTAAGSQLFLFGGFTSPPYQPQIKIFNDAYRYEPARNVWNRFEGFNLPGYAWTATAIGEKQIMLTGRVPELDHVSDEVWLVDLSSLNARFIGRLVTPSCCMPSIPMGVRTWWLPGGEPDTQRSRTARTSIVEF